MGDRVGIGVGVGVGELSGDALFRECVEGRGARCRWRSRSLELSASRKGIVGAGWHRFQGICWLRTVVGPRVVGTSSGKAFLWLWLLRLLREHVHSIGVVCVEGRVLRLERRLRLQCRLWLQEVVLGLSVWVLVKNAGLESVGVSVGHAGRLVRESGGLRVLVVQVASCKGLLSVDRVAKPVNGILLLVALVVPGRLGRSGLHGGIVKEGLCVALLQLPLAEFLFFLAQSNGTGQILVILGSFHSLRSSSPFVLRFILARLDRQTVFRVVFVIVPPTWPLRSSRGFVAITLEVIETAHTRFPELAVGPFAAQSIFVEDEGGEFLCGNTYCTIVS